jgi:hypothetical protein
LLPLKKKPRTRKSNYKKTLDLQLNDQEAKAKNGIDGYFTFRRKIQPGIDLLFSNRDGSEK